MAATKLEQLVIRFRLVSSRIQGVKEVDWLHVVWRADYLYMEVSQRALKRCKETHIMALGWPRNYSYGRS